MDRRLIVMRGIPGSGKSTLAKRLKSQSESEDRPASIVSADMFFMKVSGDGQEEYCFDPTKIGEAHAWCMAQVLWLMRHQQDTVILDNTNTRLWEFKHYMEAAKLAGYSVEIVELKAETIADVKLFASRNTHGVPAAVVAQMAMQYEDSPS